MMPLKASRAENTKHAQHGFVFVNKTLNAYGKNDTETVTLTVSSPALGCFLF